jgi:ribonuclease E
MLETELNDSQQNETAHDGDSDGGAGPSGLTGTASASDAGGTASGTDPAASGESSTSQRRTRRPRRAATRDAGPPAEAPPPPPAQVTASAAAASAASASAAPPASAPIATTAASSPAATPVVPPAPAAPGGSGSVPQATFQPPPVIFQPPAAGEPAADRSRVRDEPASEDTGPDEPSGDAASEGTSRRRRRRGGRSRGHDADGEAPGEDTEDGDSAPARSRREPAERGGKAAEARHDDAKPGEGRQARGKQAQANQAEGKPGGPEDLADDADEDGEEGNGTRRRRRRRRRGTGSDGEPAADDPPNTVVHVRVPRPPGSEEPVSVSDVRSVRGSTRLEAKRQRRREGRESGRRRPPVITEAEFLARRESVDRVMVVRQQNDRTQIAVLEDDVLVEHYVDKGTHQSMVGNVYLGKVQNVLPSMEAAFVDVGKGRNAVLYAGEVNFDASGLEGDSKRIESALKSGQSVLVQVTKDPVGHKGARLTSQVSLPGRYLVYVPGGSMMGISRKLPDKERTRLKQILKQVMPDGAGVIVRTAAEGATEDELSRDVARLAAQWEAIEKKSKTANAPELLYSEPDLTIRVVRDIFNEDFASLVVAGDEGWDLVQEYVRYVAPHLAERLTHWTDDGEDVFARYRIDEQLAKALERKVWLPSGGSLVIDNTEAMTVVDVNTGKFTGQGGNLEETVTRNNLEAAEEIVRQLRLRDVGGIIVIDFIDMVLESNRDLVLRRMLECLARDRTKHQVAEVTSLGLVQMTRKRVGAGLLEAFSEPCDCCNGRGRIISLDLTEPSGPAQRGHSGGDDGRQAGGGRQERNGRADRNGQDRNAQDKNGRGDRNGQDKNGQDKNPGRDRNGQQDRTSQQDRDRQAADPGTAGTPDAGEPAASDSAAAVLVVGAPAERQGGRRRRRSGGSAATHPESAQPEALLPEPVLAEPGLAEAGLAEPVLAEPAPSGLAPDGAPPAETAPETGSAADVPVQGETPAAAAIPGPETVPTTQAGTMAEASPAGEALTAADAASAVSSWPAGDALPAGDPASAWDAVPATPATDPATATDLAPATDPAPEPDRGDSPADHGPAAEDEEHPPF